jgi:hypothetical protein
MKTKLRTQKMDDSNNLLINRNCRKMRILQKAQGFVDALKDEHLQQRFIQN